MTTAGVSDTLAAAATPFHEASKLRICFVAHNAFSALAGGQLRHTGGIEWQESLMARWLAARGHEVSMVTWDEGQGAQVQIHGVRVLSLGRESAGLPGLRFIHPRWTGLYRALRQANADLYYHNCGDAVLGQLALWCQWHRRACVYSVSCDPACDRRLPMLNAHRQRLLYRYGLRHADRVIVQTRHQQSMLREHFGVASDVLPMPCEDAAQGRQSSMRQRSGATRSILWIGRFAEQKRLEWMLDVAER